MPRLRLSGNQDRCRDQVRNILIGLPNLPQFRSTRPTALRIGSNERDGLSQACPAAPLLVMALREVIVQMDDIRDPRPMFLNNIEPECG
jgi:hypothetical protein